ncbi:hypothetical protein [Pyxidicoccus sp. MSG2]|uniref:hypothetical protein n=1 Tax=Pyxidicoccus sp. MSG2 TaxID=2996790 RepID=UPI0022711218|nr:hypothetical protein [Pyxidicoccus sp. MSG2]MCY1023068.1 hypothetical protein [Pyxidicoccus sp. MSG2]
MPKVKLGGGLSSTPSISRSSSSPSVGGAEKRKRTDDVGSSSPAKKPKTDEVPKDNTTEARLKRKFVRDQRRQESGSAVASQSGTSSFRTDAGSLMKKNPKNEAKTQLDTPFGPVNASKFPTSDPAFKITSEKKHYGKQAVGHKYSDLVSGLQKSGASDKEIATDLLNALEGKKPQKLTSGEAKNAAAKLSAITHVSEPQRVLGSDKAARGVLRMVQDGKISLDDAFKGDTPTFPMAKNPDYMRRTVNYEDKNYRKETPKPTQFDKLGGYMSDSSDDEG